MEKRFILLLVALSLGAQNIPLNPDPCWVYVENPNKTRGAVLGDINNDGFLDLAITREDGFNYIFINQNGSFPSTPSYMLADSAPHLQLAFGDYDNDGDLDLAVGSAAMMGGRIRLYRNENGMINPNPVWVAPAHGAMWVGWGDVDNDGDLDLACADMFQFPCVFRNNNGTLESSPFWEAADYNIDMSGCWFDVDNDGDLDLAIGQIPESYPMRIYFNNNGILETSASWIAVPPHHYPTGGLAVGDIDKNGWFDLFQADGGSGTYQGPNYLYMNQSTGLDPTPSWVSSDILPSTGVQFGDLNGDNYLDVACANLGYPIVVYRNNNGNLIAFPDWISNVDGKAACMIALGDIDNDGIGYYVDTISSDTTKKLYYLSKFPIHKVDSIKINESLIPLSDYCYLREYGWVSLKNTPPQGAFVYVYYTYSCDMELVTCNYVFKNNLGIKEAKIALPQMPELETYPNPFKEKLNIKLEGIDGRWQLKIYDATGRLVRDLLPSSLHILSTVVSWDGTDDAGCKLSPGVYVVRLETQNFCTTQKIIKLK